MTTLPPPLTSTPVERLILHLTEWQQKAVSLTPSDLEFLARPGTLPTDALTPGGRPGAWWLRASHYVGVFELPSMTVQVTPKTGGTASTLLYMLAYAAGIKRLPIPTADLALAPTALIDGLARLFLDELGRQFARGIIRQYQPVEENSLALRGRLRVAEYLRRTDPVRLPVEYSTLTADHALNRLFLLTLTRLVRQLREPDLRRRAARLQHWLLDAGVMPLHAFPRRGPPFEVTRLSRRYEQALELAWLILEGNGALQDHGAFRGEAFTFNMNRLYERFLEQVILRELLLGSGYTARAQTLGKNAYLFLNNVQEVKPDLTIFKGGQARLIVDFKNKPPDHQLDGGDLYQIYAYARHLSCSQVLLLYPGSARPVRQLTAAGSPDLTITAGTLDLSRSLPAHLGDVTADLRALLALGGLPL